MSENDRFRAKPDPGQNLSGKIFASRNSPLHVDSKYVLFKKPDYRTKFFLAKLAVQDFDHQSLQQIY